MRLIDADVLKSVLSDKDYITYTHEYGEAIPVEWLMSAIDNAPTVERPQGEWIILDGGDRGCPFCNMGTSRESNASLVFFNYCPYCGAELNELKEAEND